MSAADLMLIVGAGQAGATAAATLRTLGHRGQIVIVGDELHRPYERPPLSKAVLGDATVDEKISIHPPDFHSENGIDLRLGVSVRSLDPTHSIAHLSDGQSVLFSRCLLATGGAVRPLSLLPPGTPRVHYLRTLDDARALRNAMGAERSVVVLGGGFLGLEMASTARGLGLAVTVIESAPRVLARALPPEMSQWLQQRVRAAGVDLRLDSPVRSIEIQDEGIALTLVDGDRLFAPLIVVAVGQQPRVDLAQAAGIELHPSQGGIRVDAQGRTSVPTVYAAGDCASQLQPLAGEELRLESWQSANEQARVAAASMLGVPAEPAALPWFWTDLFDCNVQMLGLPVPGLTYIARGETAANNGARPKFMLLGLSGLTLRHAIAVNAGGELRSLRELIERGTPCDPSRLQDTNLALRQVVRDAIADATPNLTR